MSARDEAHESVKPSAQRGGATPSEEDIARKGGWSATASQGIVPAEGGRSDAPEEMLAEDPQLGSVLGVTTGSDEPATEAGVNLDGGEHADATTDRGPDLSSGVEPDLKDAAAAASGPDEDHTEPELTREGLLGALAGKAKEAVGELVGNEDLARAGRVQQAEINADAEAVREADQD